MNAEVAADAEAYTSAPDQHAYSRQNTNLLRRGLTPLLPHPASQYQPPFDREELKRLIVESLRFDLHDKDNPKVWLELKNALDYAEAHRSASLPVTAQNLQKERTNASDKK